MKVNIHYLRKKQLDFVVGMISIDGGHPSAFIKKLLDEYEKSLITSRELKRKL